MIFIIAFLKPPFCFANLAEYIPGFLFNAKISKPESSESEINFDFLKKKLAFNSEFDLKDLPVSFGAFIFKLFGEIFLIFLLINLLISLNFPSL